MGFLFPWTNLHELNLDWLLDRVKHIPSKTSQLINDSGFITQAQTAPVQSVNGQTGAVVLSAADVGAKPASYAAPVDSVNGQTGAVVIDIPDPSSSNPLMDGTVSIGSSDDYARADHRHPKDTSKANLASPTFTGTPKAPTAGTGDNTTQLATTAFVQGEFTAHRPVASVNTTFVASIPSGSWKNVAEISFTPGLYLVSIGVIFNSNATGIRRLNLASSSGTSSYVNGDTVDSRNACTTGPTPCAIQTMLSFSENKTYYVNVYQDSGSNRSLVDPIIRIIKLY